MSWLSRLFKREKKEPVENMMDAIGRGLSAGNVSVNRGVVDSLKEGKDTGAYRSGRNTSTTIPRDDDDNDMLLNTVVAAVVVNELLSEGNVNDPTPADMPEPGEDSSPMEASSNDNSSSSDSYSSSDSGSSDSSSSGSDSSSSDSSSY